MGELVLPLLDCKMRTEKSGSSGFSSALDLAQNDLCVVRVLPRPEKKSLVEMVFWRRTGLSSLAKARTENLDHMGFLKANNLATPVLDCERATESWITLVP